MSTLADWRVVVEGVLCAASLMTTWSSRPRLEPSPLRKLFRWQIYNFPIVVEISTWDFSDLPHFDFSTLSAHTLGCRHMDQLWTFHRKADLRQILFEKGQVHQGGACHGGRRNSHHRLRRLPGGDARYGAHRDLLAHDNGVGQGDRVLHALCCQERLAHLRFQQVCLQATIFFRITELHSSGEVMPACSLPLRAST